MQSERSFMPPSIPLHFDHGIGVEGRALTVLWLLLWISASTLACSQSKPTVNCNIQKGSCEKTVAGTNVILEISPKPVRAMGDLTFRVTVADPEKMAAVPYIDLNMPAMDMGGNRVLLKDLGQGVYEGRGVIVRCMSGKRTWRARITLPEIGSADFIFDVVY
jgi:hypothetical protein